MRSLQLSDQPVWHGLDFLSVVWFWHFHQKEKKLHIITDPGNTDPVIGSWGNLINDL
jgi:hypothetical protein